MITSVWLLIVLFSSWTFSWGVLVVCVVLDVLLGGRTVYRHVADDGTVTEREEGEDDEDDEDEEY